MSVGEYRGEHLFEDLPLADNHLAYLIDDSPRHLLKLRVRAHDGASRYGAVDPPAASAIARLPDLSMSISSFVRISSRLARYRPRSAVFGFFPVAVARLPNLLASTPPSLDLTTGSSRYGPITLPHAPLRSPPF